MDLDALGLIMAIGISVTMQPFVTDVLKRSTLFCHIRNKSPKDLKKVTILFEEAKQHHEVELATHLPGFLSIQSIDDLVAITPADLFTPVKSNKFSVVGYELFIDSEEEIDTINVHYFASPDLEDLATTDSWIYKNYPYVVAAHAANTISRKLKIPVILKRNEEPIAFEEEYTNMAIKERLLWLL